MISSLTSDFSNINGYFVEILVHFYLNGSKYCLIGYFDLSSLFKPHGFNLSLSNLGYKIWFNNQIKGDNVLTELIDTDCVPSITPAKRNFIWKGKDNLELAGSRWGDSDLPSIVFTHGAGQTRHSWRRTAEEFAKNGYHSVTTDTRGHGDSQWCSKGDYSLESMMEDLRLLIAQQNKKPVLVGASLGGITSLVAVGEGLISCSALVLVDVAPRVDPNGVARILSFMKGHLDGFESIEEAQAAVAAYNPSRSQAKASGKGLKKNLRLIDGRYHWHWDPLFLDQPERSDSDVQAAQEERRIKAAGNIDVPVLLVRGAMSDIVSEQSVKDLQAMIPHAKVVEVSNAGHMVAGDSNQVFAEAVTDFVDRLSIRF